MRKPSEILNELSRMTVGSFALNEAVTGIFPNVISRSEFSRICKELVDSVVDGQQDCIKAVDIKHSAKFVEVISEDANRKYTLRFARHRDGWYFDNDGFSITPLREELQTS